MKAKVLKSDKKNYLCKIIDCHYREGTVLASASGKLFHKNNGIVVGDIVELSIEGDQFVISSRNERKNEIFRLLVRERKKKVIAANCDFFLITVTCSQPDYKRGLVDRYLARAHQWSIPCLLIFNKADQYDSSKFDINFEAKRVKDLGVESFEMSALKGKDYQNKFLKCGLSDLREYLVGKTTILLGQSGVGKSQLVSCLSNGRHELLSSKISKSGKGAHTTTWAEIIDFEDFEIIDSPGIRSFSLDDIDPLELLEYFPDLEEIAIQCKFRDCSHHDDSKGCAFYNDKVVMDKEVVMSRLESYQRIFQEISENPMWKKNY